MTHGDGGTLLTTCASAGVTGLRLQKGDPAVWDMRTVEGKEGRGDRAEATEG